MLRIATVGSLFLWAAIAWCMAAMSLVIHRNPLRISASGLTASLLCICLATAVAGLWIGEELRWRHARTRGSRSGGF